VGVSSIAVKHAQTLLVLASAVFTLSFILSLSH